MLTLVLPNRTVLLLFVLRPQVLIDTGPRPISPLPKVKDNDEDDSINNHNDDVNNHKDNTPSLNGDSNSDSDFFADIDNIYPSPPPQSTQTSDFVPTSTFYSTQSTKEEEDYRERIKDLPAAYIARLREAEYKDLDKINYKYRYYKALYQAFKRTNKNAKSNF